MRSTSASSSVRIWSAIDPAHHPTEGQVDHGGQIEPALPSPDVGDVAHVDPVELDGARPNTRLIRSAARTPGSEVVVLVERRRRIPALTSGESRRSARAVTAARRRRGSAPRSHEARVDHFAGGVRPRDTKPARQWRAQVDDRQMSGWSLMYPLTALRTLSSSASSGLIREGGGPEGPPLSPRNRHAQRLRVNTSSSWMRATQSRELGNVTSSWT